MSIFSSLAKLAILVFAMTDGVVLAESAEQIATAEKDRARAAAANQNTLFAKMRAVTRHLSQGSGSAVTLVTRQAIHTALPRTEAAATE